MQLARWAIFFQNAGIGIVFVFIPIFSKGITDSIFSAGISLSIFYLSQMISEIYFGRLSDKTGKRLVFIRSGFIAATAIFAIASTIETSIHLFLTMAGAGVAVGMIIPSLLAYSYDIQEKKRKTASLIAVTTLGWLTGIIITGIHSDVFIIFPTMSVLFFAGFIISLKMKPIKVEIQHVSLIKVIQKNKIIFAGLLTRQTGAAALVTVLPLYLIENLHAQIHHIVIVYAMNMIIAFVIMQLMSKQITMRYSKAFKLGIILSIVAFAGMPIITEWYQIIPFMLLAGATWAFMYIGGILHLMKSNPKSTANGLFNSIFALSSVIGPLIAGVIASLYDYVTVTWVIVGFMVAASGIVYRLKIDPNPESAETSPKT